MITAGEAAEMRAEAHKMAANLGVMRETLRNSDYKVAAQNLDYAIQFIHTCLQNFDHGSEQQLQFTNQGPQP